MDELKMLALREIKSGIDYSAHLESKLNLSSETIEKILKILEREGKIRMGKQDITDSYSDISAL